MTSVISVIELTEEDWQRYRSIRLRALEEDGEAFGGNYESESAMSEDQWRQRAQQYIGLVATMENKDIAFMTVENLKGDFGATCWIGSCWVDRDFRKRGALKALFAHVDTQAEERDWLVQGLGVWVTNREAISAYEKIGFEVRGEPQESSRKAGIFYQRMVRDLSN